MESRSGVRKLRGLAGPALAVALVLAAAPAASAYASSGAPVSALPAADAPVPSVTLNQPVSPSNDTTPSFSGTASDVTPVTVAVYAGSAAEGVPVTKLKIEGDGGGWTSANVNPPLVSGVYTALAMQPSSLGGPTGVSNSVTFQIDTNPPVVTLQAPVSPSNNTTPSFSGTASEATLVTVEIFDGMRPEGEIVATITALPSGGNWTSGPLPRALVPGVHSFTAVATQPSAIGNPPGASQVVTFVVDTDPPTVTLSAPPSPSNDTTPTFDGTSSESSQVEVEIFPGTKAEGAVLATATAPVIEGDWTSDELAPALAGGTYTALAIQSSAIKNPAGASAPVTFVVDTSAPTVTLSQLFSPSSDAAPSFSGSASDRTPVSVTVHRGDSSEGQIVTTAIAEVAGGEWVSARTEPALPWGVYTAVATQPSSIGNPAGTSAPMTFTVEPIPPTVATEAASAVTATSAALYASVDPNGGTVSACNFEYGTTPSYGGKVECGFANGLGGFPPASTAAVPVFVRIYGLRPGTTYHFHVIASDEGGAGEGVDQTFTTLPAVTFDHVDPPAVASSSRGGPSAGGSADTHAALSGNLLTRLAAQLMLPGRAATIAGLLRAKTFRARLSAPEPGTAVVRWYHLGLTDGRSGKAIGTRELVASGETRFRAAGASALIMRLTSAGVRLLENTKRIRLTAVCIFTPVATTPVWTSATFEVTR